MWADGLADELAGLTTWIAWIWDWMGWLDFGLGFEVEAELDDGLMDWCG